MRSRYIIVWFNPNKKIYYYKYYTYLWDYEVGFKNQYNHEIILIIDLLDIFDKVPFKKKVLKKIISFLQKLYKKL